MAVKIDFQPYNEAWPQVFEEERQRLSSQLSGMEPVIEHIGSTAVPGLGACPIIDILVGLPAGTVPSSAVEPLTELGYCYYSCYKVDGHNGHFFARLSKLAGLTFETESQIPQSGAFPPTHHLHLITFDSHHWHRHLAYRDYLRRHAMARDAYHRLKAKLARKGAEGLNDYANAKAAFFGRMEWLVELGGGDV